MDFDAALGGTTTHSGGDAVKNAAWVYESELYKVVTNGDNNNDNIVINNEVLGILHSIFTLGERA